MASSFVLFALRMVFTLLLGGLAAYATIWLTLYAAVWLFEWWFRLGKLLG